MVKDFELYYPVKPFGLNQGFGQNPEYYAKFLDEFGNPEKGHNGVDLMAAHATPLYAPCDGSAFYLEDAHGGAGIYIDSPKGYRVILFHLCTKTDPHYSPLIPTNGTRVSVITSQLIGYTDNSGAPFESSGDHLHVGLIKMDAKGNLLDRDNGFNGCIDPLPFFNRFYAIDSVKVVSLYQKAIDLLTAYLSSLNVGTIKNV